MQKILVTGGAGNIGGELVKRLVSDPANQVVVVDNLTTGSKAKLPNPAPANFTFIKGDVNMWEDIAPIMTSYQFDYVFHYAAVVGVARTLANPILVLQDIDGIKNVLTLCKNTGVKRVFYSSSSEVYGEPVEFPQNEHTTPLNSRLPYAVVKNVGEAFLRSYHQEFGLEYTIFRFFNTYGPGQSVDFVVPKFLGLAMDNEDITIYGSGDQTRTFCLAKDNIDAVVNIMETGFFTNDVVNIGSDEEWTVLDLAKYIIDVTGSRSRIVHYPPLPEGDMTRRKPDISKMRQVLGRPLTSVRDGVKLTYEALCQR